MIPRYIKKNTPSDVAWSNVKVVASAAATTPAATYNSTRFSRQIPLHLHGLLSPHHNEFLAPFSRSSPPPPPRRLTSRCRQAGVHHRVHRRHHLCGQQHLRSQHPPPRGRTPGRRIRLPELLHVPQGGLRFGSQLHFSVNRGPYLGDRWHLRREHTETDLGFGIDVSSSWIRLAFLLAAAGMAWPEKRHCDAFNSSGSWGSLTYQLGWIDTYARLDG